MIELHYNQGGILVFDVDDWATLRKVYRVLGTLIGTTKTVPTLPLKLLPEEALLLLDKNIAKVTDRQFNITPVVQQKHKDFEQDLLEEEKVVYRNNRKKQLEIMINDIVAAKRKKGDERSTEEIFNEELDKSSKVTLENMIWPTLVTPLTIEGNPIEVPRESILKYTSELKYRVYKDLWERNYYITTGHKFGANFLVYLGDPLAYHAIFIIHCIDNPDDALHSTEIVSLGRLATAVKKRAVLASLQNDQIFYITINWIDD